MRCLQVLACFILIFKALNANPFLDKNGSEKVVSRFMKRLINSMKKHESIDSFFRNDFSFDRCVAKYNKTEAVVFLSFLSSLEVGIQRYFDSTGPRRKGFFFHLGNSQYLTPHLIEYRLSIESNDYNKIDRPRFEAVLVLNVENETHQLVCGRSPDCGRSLL
uniref:NTF2-like domain-containing protein n=1 Tax=Caenorhabditis japonica TaxID=281687 RepID=A0A8R1INH9_CAEJA